MEDCAGVGVDFFFFFVDDDEDDVADVEDDCFDFFFFFLLPLLDGFFAASIRIMIPMYTVCVFHTKESMLERMCTSCEHF